MLTVCEKHMKEAISLLNVPHVTKLSQRYKDYNCAFCGNPAHYKLFYSTPIESIISKIKIDSYVSEL